MPQSRNIQSVVRALDILELAGSSADGVRLRLIAHALGLKRQTAYGLVRTLVSKGYLDRVSSPVRYRLSPVMEGLRSRQARWNRLLAVATPIVVKLSNETRGLVAIGQYLGNEVIARFRASPMEGVPTRYSRRWHMRPYGTGVLMQAYLNADDLAYFRRRQPLIGAGSESYWGSTDLLDEFLGTVRREGLLTMLHGGLFRAAVAILAPAGSLIGALTLVRPFDEMPPGEANRCILLLRLAAGKIADAFA